MKSNSLGYAIEVKPSTKTNTLEVVTVNDIEDQQPKRYFTKTSNMLCCILTTLLVSSGIGIGIWFALTPVD